MCCLRLIRQIRGRAFLRQWLMRAAAAASWGARVGVDKGRKRRQRPTALGTSLAWEPRFSLRTCASLLQKWRSPRPHHCPSAACLKGGATALPKTLLRSRAAGHTRYLQPAPQAVPARSTQRVRQDMPHTEGNVPPFTGEHRQPLAACAETTRRSLALHVVLSRALSPPPPS